MYRDRSTEQSIILVPKSEAGSGCNVTAAASLLSSINVRASLFATHYRPEDELNLPKSGLFSIDDNSERDRSRSTIPLAGSGLYHMYRQTDKEV